MAHRIEGSTVRLGALLALLMLAQAPALALPAGEKVAAGQAGFSRSAGRLDVTQFSDKAIIDYGSFSIGLGETVNFLQPGADAVALNRVPNGPISTIEGALNANGRIFLINPAGVIFGDSAVINVHGLLASSLGMSDEDFLAGRYVLRAAPDAGPVANHGRITATPGGGVYLVAPQVTNTGSIDAPGGSVGLAGASRVYLTDDPAGHVLVELDGADGSAQNVGSILATGGSAGIYGAVVNQDGIVRADSVVQRDGHVELVASDSVRLGPGSVTASDGAEPGARGGEVTVAGRQVELRGATVSADGESGGSVRIGAGPALADATSVDAPSVISAQATGQGHGGTVEVSAADALDFRGIVSTAAADGSFGLLLLDPTDLTVDAALASTIEANLLSTNVTMTTSGTGGNGDIAVDAPINWSSPSALTFLAHRDINVNAGILCDGPGDVALLAGWNESAGTDVAALLVDPGNYGLGGGSVYMGDGAQAVGIAVGSRFGTTQVAGFDLDLTGGTPTNGFCQIGFPVDSQGDTYYVDGPINVFLNGSLAATGGDGGAAYVADRPRRPRLGPGDRPGRALLRGHPDRRGGRRLVCRRGGLRLRPSRQRRGFELDAGQRMVGRLLFRQHHPDSRR